ncbi:RNA polymerase sigma factor [Streptomyces yaanensis]|uniref:RNA polymerase sigma factor n=1 Tax=Streptomyces yaanensis TaxID=1142239 RepID=A0ABV7SNP1_9ACTN|nr:RNA polymerase subunit sigma-70 [Streptomyces sp. CGMCC 4.7035]WNB97309.1 RNA polymerase subunit sigma-70 [Streptomyces sp. CGMCC 4.7035]
MTQRHASPAGEPDTQKPPPADAPMTPHQAFDALYEFCAPALVRQAYLLTGRRQLAREAVVRAFHLAWQRWPEVAMDRDPAGWVRAAAHDYALSPWHRFRPRYRHAEPPLADPSDRALMHAFLKLPPVYRRTLLLYDGIGLDLPDTAAETEASTPAAANRLLHAREALAALVPELATPDVLPHRLAALATSARLHAAGSSAVRADIERRTRDCSRAAMALAIGLVGVTALALHVAPDHYERPMARGTPIEEPPPPPQGPLSPQQLTLHAKLKANLNGGPARMIPEPR